MKNRHYFFSFFAIVILLVIFLFIFKNYSNFESTDNAYVRGSITTISSRIEGYVIEVPGVLNTKIKKGDILAKFDDAPFIAVVDKSRAEFKAATAQLSEIDLKQKTEKLKIEEQKLQLKLAQNNIMSAIAKRDSEISNLVMYKNEENRIKKLLKTKNVTRSNYEKALANYKFSKHRVEQYEADLASEKIFNKVIQKKIEKIELYISKLQVEKDKLLANQEALKAKLDNSLIDLNSTIVKAPIDGTIANRIVEPGVYMKKGWPLMSVVPTKDVWIIANFKETQIKNITIGQKAVIEIDAFSNLKLEGKVLSFSPASASSFSLIPPQNASGNFVKVVQRVPVKITMSLPNSYVGKIIPGMSAKIKVYK
jgi:membrane fusion protein (multidrug efflux system)